jgi:cytochrome-b5 reductase
MLLSQTSIRTHTLAMSLSKASRFILPAVLVAGGAYFYQTQVANKSTSTTTTAPPVLAGDGQWVDLRLKAVKPVSHDTSIYTFGFPDPNSPSGLVTASAVLTKYVTPKGSNVIRPYTPISDNEQKGSFDLLVKTYEGGKMSVHIKSLQINDVLAFKGPIQKWKWQPNQFSEIGLIGGGTGITPLYQVIHEVLKNEADKTKITLLYGSKSSEDILLKTELDSLAAKHPDRFQVQYFVDEAKSEDKAASNLNVGFITKEVIEKNLPKPSAASHVFICGPPPLYKALSGPKVSPTDQGEVTGVLAELGYDKTHVFKF